MKRDYLYCNEANELKIEDWNQLIFRTTDKVICDLNPSDLNSWVYDLEKRDDCYLFKTTWRDNPFVSDTIIKELESLREKDENLYRIYNLGEKGIATQLVFTKFNTIEQIPNMKLLGRVIFLLNNLQQIRLENFNHISSKKIRMVNYWMFPKMTITTQSMP